MLFIVRISISTYLWLFVVQLGCGQDISDNYQEMEVNTIELSSSLLSYVRPPQAAVNSIKRSCMAPRQPDNGEWRPHPNYCGGVGVHCKVPEGTELGLGYQLIYSCAAGYKIEGNNTVLCTANGDWSSIPSCKEIRCHALNTVSWSGQCERDGKILDCNLPVLPQTSAVVTCQPGYRQVTTGLSPLTDNLHCNEAGEWEPQPITCIPACGQVATAAKPLSVNGWNASVVDFPWHATLYEAKNLLPETKKEFICGGTIIRANIVMTVAHCVYDEPTQTPKDARKLFVATGNIFRDYDHPMHELNIVKKAAVQQVFIHSKYYGLRGNYASDIALLELQEPFVLSEILLPACLDFNGFHLENGSLGKLAGFGETATDDSSPTLQTLSPPYIPDADCQNSTHAIRNYFLVTDDKFCAGFTNGSAACQGDSGGGLVFEKDRKWYVMGIVSLDLGLNIESGVRMCQSLTYTLYTRVSNYAAWISEEIQNIEGKTRSPTSSTNMLRVDEAFVVPSSCSAPPQPPNGQWRLHPTYCSFLGYTNVSCKVSPGVKINFDSRLVYICDAGYKVSGNTEIYCTREGTWSSSPTCVEIKCRSLNTTTLKATCHSGTGEPMSCESPVPSRTRADLRCRGGYRKDTGITPTAISFPEQSVICNTDGEWEPEPIKCTPACGHAITHEQSLAVNGSDAKLGEFPWRASIYTETNEGRRKDFLCDATIIEANILLTAAHCVYNEKTGATDDPEKFIVLTGNVFRDFDSPFHDSSIVQNRTVKSVHISCQYSEYLYDDSEEIALLELDVPLYLSSVISPACIDLSVQFTQSRVDGAFGKISRFGTTTTEPSSDTLQTITVFYNKCKQSSRDRRFCARYTDGFAICEGDSGGGLFYEKNGRWSLLGIASKGLTNTIYNGGRRCDPQPYTRVLGLIQWTQRVIHDLKRHRSHISCY